MIPNVQIDGEPDTHPEKPIHDAYQLATGQIDPSSLTVTAHNVRVFDLMDRNDRKEYEKLYVELMGKSRQGRIFIVGNTRETLVMPDGSTRWFKFLEWSEYDTSDILGA